MTWAGSLRILPCICGALSLMVCTAVSTYAQAPSLAELAKKEQQRRKSVPAPQKVYTNKDLPPAPPAPPASGADAAPATDATTAATPQQDPKPAAERKPDGEERDEAWWRDRITSVREELRRNEVFLEALQSRVNSLSADFVNRDDPYQRSKIGEDRQKALAEMDRVKQQIDAGRKLIDDIEEEARKAGVPPGWLR